MFTLGLVSAWTGPMPSPTLDILNPLSLAKFAIKLGFSSHDSSLGLLELSIEPPPKGNSK